MINAASFEELFFRQQESGLSIRDFCSNEGIHPSTFYYRQKKHREKNSPKEFIPLTITGSFPAQHSGKAIAMDNQGTPTADHGALVEFVYPNGTRVLLKQQPDLALMKVMIHLYD